MSEQKQKKCLKNIEGEKSNLFAYLRFCARKEKRTEKRKLKKREKSSQGNVLGSLSM